MRNIRRLTALCLAVFLMLSILPCGAVAANSSSGAVEWAGTYTGQYNNAVTTAPIPTTSTKLVKVWDAAVGNGAVAIIGDYVYTYNGTSGGGVTNNGTFYKVNKDTGEIAASLELGVGTGNYYSYTFCGNGLLYINCPNALMCVDPESFTLKWKTEHATTQHFCSAQLINGFIVANGYVYNATNGSPVKTLPGSYSWANGAEVGGYYYVAATGKLYSFDTTTWAVKDSIDFTGSGAGVLYHNSRLYWGGSAGNVYSVKVNNGSFEDSTMLTNSWGYVVTAPPVALGSRVYFAGTQVTDTTYNTGYGAIGVFDTSSLSLQYNGLLEGVGHKLQAVPILRSVTSGGNVAAGNEVLPTSADMASAPQTSTAHVYVQDYASPSSIYVLTDTAGQSSGSPQRLITIDPANYAFEQFACDKDGAIYCTNDSGYLVKYGEATAAVPMITGNLSVNEVVYSLGDNAAALSITATVSSGTLSYQWQSHNGDGIYSNIKGATSAQYTPSTAAAGTTFYRCIVTNTAGSASAKTYSNIAKITVKSGSGDVNGDGKIGAEDVVSLRKYLAGRTDGVVAANADVDKNDKVNLADLIQLSRHVAWGVPLP